MQYILGLIFLLAPAYQIRFVVFGLHLNFLIIAVFFVWITFIVWLIKTGRVADFIKTAKQLSPWLKLGIIGLLFAATVSLFVGGIDQAKLGQYLVLFIQPVSIFFIARYVFSAYSQSKEWLVYGMYIFLAITGIYAVVQYYTLIGLPVAWWGNTIEPKRALVFFNHPDAFALFLTPVLAFLLADVSARVSRIGEKFINFLPAMAWLAGFVGLIYTLSRGGWIGFLASAVIFALLSANKKYIYGALALVVIAAGFIYYIPNFRYRIILPIFHRQRSAFARLTVWDAGIKMIKDSPILGKGLNGYSKNWEHYTSDPALEHHNFPHQIFLNFWVETGLLGLFSFFAVLVYSFSRALKYKAKPYYFGVILFLTALLAHGLLDNPYFKNDLALVFWLVLALL